MPMNLFSKNEKYNIVHIYIHNHICIYTNMELRINNPEQQKAFDELMEQLGPAIDTIEKFDKRAVAGRIPGYHGALAKGATTPSHWGKGGMHRHVPATDESRAALAASLRGQLSPPGSPRRGAAAAREAVFDPSTPRTTSVQQKVREIERLRASGIPLIRPGQERAAARLMARDDRVLMVRGMPDPDPAAGALAGEVPCHLNPVLSFAIDAVIVLATCAGSLYLIDVGTGFLANFFTAFGLPAATSALLMTLYDALKSAVRLAGSTAGIPAPVALGAASEASRVAMSAAHTVYDARYFLGLGAWYRYMIRGNSVSEDLNRFVVRPAGHVATTVAALARGVRTRAQAARDAVVDRYAAEVRQLPDPNAAMQSVAGFAQTAQGHRNEFKRRVCLLIDRVVNSRMAQGSREFAAAVAEVLADPEFDLPAAMGRSGGKHRKRTMHKRSKKHHKKHHKKSRKHRS
jgi:hypothetical protein